MRSNLIDLAILIKETETSQPIWLPKSRIEIDITPKAGIIVITMPETFAVEKGLL